jgi:hypothetical protein
VGNVEDDVLAVRVARARWRAAEDRLYPSLLTDPSAYQRCMTALQAVVAELRDRARDAAGLMAAEAGAERLVATACPDGVPIPAELLVAVACGTVDRELSAESERRRRLAAVDAARAAGHAWAVVDGPQDAAELTEGRMVAVHLGSGVVVQATVDPWARDEAFGLEVVPAGPQRSFTDRDEWLAELAATRAEIETRPTSADPA